MENGKKNYSALEVDSFKVMLPDLQALKDILCKLEDRIGTLSELEDKIFFTKK